MTLVKLIDHYVQQVKYAREVLLAMVVVAVVVVGGLTYRWYVNNRIEQAHQALAEAIELFNKSNDQENVQLWQQIDAALAQGYSKYGSTALGPYFLAFQAESAVRQGKKEEARELLKNAVAHLSSDMPLYYDYVIKLACMNMDSGNADLVEQGKRTLQAMVDDVKHPANSMAAYYLGLYFFEFGDNTSAQVTWSTLAHGNAAANAAWATMAKAKSEYAA